METLKTFLASPEGAAAISGLFRAVLMAAVGFGAQITQPQVDNLMAVVTAMMVLISLGFTGATVATVRSRANQEEVDAAVSGKVLVDNNATPRLDA